MSDSVKEQAFAAVDRKLRSASIAEIGGFRPPADPATSWFGGNFILPPSEAWPATEHGAMLPLLQVVVAELPYAPVQLEGTALVQVFLDSKQLPLDLPAPSGNRWLLKARPGLGGLERRMTPPEAALLRPFPVRWRRAKNEAPTWDEACGPRMHDEFVHRADSIDLFHDHYSSHHATKVGGWPSWIQGAVSPGGEHFVLQIASEEKPRLMLGDNGKLYIFEVNGEWLLQWDCY